ncbi:STAS domain-containing protein [Nocardioides endophyticus]|uniref:Anti-sigma factor antagonist n=1 Tax=Nocardioides endophyticus TaxID=1353775 RepID=A0ABP8ZM09_9ACTN
MTTIDDQPILAISDELLGDTRVVRCVGEIDIATVPELRDRVMGLQVDGPPRLVIDLTGVTFIDSLGLGALIGIHKRARVLQGSLVVVPSPAANRVLVATALDRVFKLHETVEAALGNGYS